MVITHSLQVKLFLDILFTLIVFIRYITVIQLGTELFVGRQLNFFNAAQVVVWIHTFSRDYMDFVLNTFSVSFSFIRLKFATKLSREEAINLKLSIKLIPSARVLPLILKKSIASFYVLNVNCFASESLMKMFGFDLISL